MLKKVLTVMLVLSLLNGFVPFSFLSPALAAEGVTMEVLGGLVQLKNTEDAPWKDVTGTMTVSSGYYINIGAGGSALVSFPDGSTIRLYEKSMLVLMNVNFVSGRRDYNMRFLGKVLTRAEGAGGGSAFISSAPTTHISTDGKEYSAEIETDLFLRVKVLEGDAKPKEAYHIRGEVKEIFTETETFTMEVKNDKGEKAIITVALHPYTVVFEGYKKYRDSGVPKDLGSIKDLKKGDDILVYGDPSGDLTFVDASLITKEGWLPVALWSFEGPSMGMTPVIIGIVGGVILGVVGGVGGGSSPGGTPGSPVQPVQ